MSIDEKPDTSQDVSIGVICRIAGCTPRTVRFYEQEGLLEPVSRTRGGRKLYSLSLVPKLKMIKALQASGLSIKDLQELLRLTESPRTADRWLTLQLRERLGSYQQSVDMKVAELQSARNAIAAALDETSRCPHCSSTDCAICGSLALLRSLGTCPTPENPS